MATTFTHSPNTEVERMVIGGSSTEWLAGAAALVLAIIGLANIEPMFMVAVSPIALGAALIFDGAVVAREYAQILSQSGNGTAESVELGGGISSQIGGGIAAMVLGILALVQLHPLVLTPIAAIVLGATMVFSSGINTRLNALKIQTSDDHEIARRVAQEALATATGSEVMVGLGAIVLGIVALVGFAPVTLTLVAMLALGSAILLSGSAVIGKMLSVFS
jgi:hypothetical protein